MKGLKKGKKIIPVIDEKTFLKMADETPMEKD